MALECRVCKPEMNGCCLHHWLIPPSSHTESGNNSEALANSNDHQENADQHHGPVVGTGCRPSTEHKECETFEQKFNSANKKLDKQNRSDLILHSLPQLSLEGRFLYCTYKKLLSSSLLPSASLSLFLCAHCDLENNPSAFCQNICQNQCLTRHSILPYAAWAQRGSLIVGSFVSLCIPGGVKRSESFLYVFYLLVYVCAWFNFALRISNMYIELISQRIEILWYLAF